MQEPSSPMDIPRAERYMGGPAHSSYGAVSGVYRHAETLHYPHEEGNGSQGSGSTKLPKKREQVKNACVNCQKACKKCEVARPCPRCVRYGMSNQCYNSARKERKKGVGRGSSSRGSNDGVERSGTSLPYYEPPIFAAAADLHYNGHDASRRHSGWDKLNVLANVCTAALEQGHSLPDSPMTQYEPSSEGSLLSDDGRMYRFGSASRPRQSDKKEWDVDAVNRHASGESYACYASQRRGSGLTSSFSSGSPNGNNGDGDSPLTKWESPIQDGSPMGPGSTTYMTPDSISMPSAHIQDLGTSNLTPEYGHAHRMQYSPSEEHFSRPSSEYSHRMPSYALERRHSPQEQFAAAMPPRIRSPLPEYPHLPHSSNRPQESHHRYSSHSYGPRHIPRQPSYPYPQHANRSIFDSSPTARRCATHNPGPYGGAGLLQYNDHVALPAPASLPSIREALNSVGLGLQGPGRGRWD